MRREGLANFGVLALTFADLTDYDRLQRGDIVALDTIHATLRSGEKTFTAAINSGERSVRLGHDLSPRQIDILLAGGVINWLRERLATGQRKSA